MTEKGLLIAEGEAKLARARLIDDLELLKDRVLPARIARRISAAFDEQVGTVQRSAKAHPAIAVSGAAVGVLILVRRVFKRAGSKKTAATPAQPIRSDDTSSRKATR